MTGALLLSRAVRSEALTRVKLNLRETGMRLKSELNLLGVTAQIQAQGLASRLSVPHPADITLFFPDRLPPSLERLGLQASGLQKVQAGVDPVLG